MTTFYTYPEHTPNTSAGPAAVTVSGSATDDLSGVAFVFAVFINPSGTLTASAAIGFSPPATSVSGTGTVTFPQFSEIGTWTLVQVVVRDALGNFREYRTTELSQLGFPTELVVTGQAEDVTPPMITVSATPKTLWPPNGRMVPVTIVATITDAGSGVDPSTTAYAVEDEYGSVEPSGSLTLGQDGRYTATIGLEASRRGNDADGRRYTITVSAQDNEGNEGVDTAIVTVPQNQGQGQGRGIAAR